MNIIGILETDHIAIRLLNKCIGVNIDPGSFKTFHLFIVNLHAKIEDDILFPAYREAYKNDTEIIYLVDRISRDHELLKTLGNNVIKYGESGESELYKRRLERYLYILIDHNTSEEKLLFPLWDDINGEIRLQADKEAVELVEKYGYQEYTRIIRMMGKNI